MFRVIEGGANDGKGLRTPLQASCITTTVGLPGQQPSVALMIDQSTKGMELKEEFFAAVNTYSSIKEFAERACEFITPYFPATSSIYPCLLTEVLDQAAIGFLRPSNRNPKEQVAHFLANGVKAAINGVLGHRVQQERNGDLQEWLPWEDGPLFHWAHWGGANLEFTKSVNQSPEVQHVAGYVVQRALLSYPAALAVARSGIDLQSLSQY